MVPLPVAPIWEAACRVRREPARGSAACMILEVSTSPLMSRRGRGPAWSSSSVFLFGFFISSMEWWMLCWAVGGICISGCWCTGTSVLVGIVFELFSAPA